VTGVGRGGRDRLRREVRVRAKGRGELLLNHLAADRRERVALRRAAMKRGGVQLDVLAAFLFIITAAAANDRFLVAGGAADRVEERAEARFGREYVLEYRAADVELAALGHGESAERRAQRRRDNPELGRGNRRGRRDWRPGRCTLIAGRDADERRE
jgi:hypothetical protein